MGMAIMEVLLPVIFLNVCGMLLKAKFGLDGAESYLIALMGVLSFLYIGGIFKATPHRKRHRMLPNMI